MILNFNSIDNINELKKFLLLFNVPEKIIELYLNKKEIIVKEKNFFLVLKQNLNNIDNNFYEPEKLLFIQLKRLVPSFYLLNLINEYGRIYNEKSYNRALKFTYGKNLIINNYNKNSLTLKEGYYLIKHKKLILGIGFVKKNKIENIFNIGEYLHEGK